MMYSKVGCLYRPACLQIHDLKGNITFSKSNFFPIRSRFNKEQLLGIVIIGNYTPPRFLPYKQISTSTLNLCKDEKLKDTKTQDIIGKDEIDYVEFEQHRLHGKALIVDVRSPEELKNNGEIPNTINIPFAHIPAYFQGQYVAKFEEEFGIKKPSENEPIIVFCRSGVRAEMAKQLLTNAPTGIVYRNVAKYPGGFDEWRHLSDVRTIGQ